MKIAAAYQDGQIFQHFGHSRAFKIYEAMDGRVVSTIVLDTEGEGHEALAGFLARAGAKALICGGIGAGAMQALEEAGIDVYAGASGSADAAVEAFLAGKLPRSGEANCDHHEEGEDHACCGCADGECGPEASEGCASCPGCGPSVEITRESLEGGEILRFLMQQFLGQPCPETYLPILRCLRDSMVWMVGEVDADGVFIPDTAENGQAVFLPVFTAPDQTEPEENEELLEVHFLDALARAQASPGLQGIVVDPFSLPCVVDREIFGIFAEIPSVIEED